MYEHERHGNATEGAAGSFVLDDGRIVLGKMRWRTSAAVVGRIATRLGLDGFDLDAAAEDDWHHGRRWFTAQDDCLARNWRTMQRPILHAPDPPAINMSAFINPPWGAKGLSDKTRAVAATVRPDAKVLSPFPGTEAFVQEAWAASRLGMTVAALLPQAFDSDWQRRWVIRADELWVGPRIRFDDFNGKPGPQPPGGHACLIFRPNVPEMGWPGGPRVDWGWTP